MIGTSAQQCIHINDCFIFGLRKAETALSKRRRAVAVLHISSVADCWSDSESPSEWETFTVSFDDLPTLLLSDGDGNNAYIMACSAFKPSWSPASAGMIHILAHRSGSGYESYLVDLAACVCSAQANILALRRPVLSDLRRLPSTWNPIGPTVSGRIISCPGYANPSACSAFGPHDPANLTYSSLFPLDVNTESTEMTIDSWSAPL